MTRLGLDWGGAGGYKLSVRSGPARARKRKRKPWQNFHSPTVKMFRSLSIYFSVAGSQDMAAALALEYIRSTCTVLDFIEKLLANWADISDLFHFTAFYVLRPLYPPHSTWQSNFVCFHS